MSARDGNPKMTRAHFKLIADVIRTVQLGPQKKQRLVQEFCNRLSSCNPHFNRERFWDACVPGKKGIK